MKGSSFPSSAFAWLGHVPTLRSARGDSPGELLGGAGGMSSRREAEVLDTGMNRRWVGETSRLHSTTATPRPWGLRPRKEGFQGQGRSHGPGTCALPRGQAAIPPDDNAVLPWVGTPSSLAHAPWGGTDPTRGPERWEPRRHTCPGHIPQPPPVLHEEQRPRPGREGNACREHTAGRVPEATGLRGHVALGVPAALGSCC